MFKQMMATRQQRKRARYLELLTKAGLNDDELDELDGLSAFLGKSQEYVEQERNAIARIQSWARTIQRAWEVRAEAHEADVAATASIIATKEAVAELWATHKAIELHARSLQSIILNGMTIRAELQQTLFRFPDLKPLCDAAYWPPQVITPDAEPSVRTGTLAEMTSPWGARPAAKATAPIPDAPGVPDAQNAAEGANAAPEGIQTPPAAVPDAPGVLDAQNAAEGAATPWTHRHDPHGLNDLSEPETRKRRRR
jgi:hypothetical protein